MELAVSENPRKTVDKHTVERIAKLMSTDNNMSQCMKSIKTSRESEIYLYNFEYLKNSYDKYIRDDFLYAFGAFYCDKVMKISHLDRILKTECYHHETELKYRHYEFATYMENIISWLDFKLKYFNGESSKCNNKIQDQLFKTSDIQQLSTRISEHCKALQSNTDSQEQNNKLKSVANSQNEIITSPGVTTPKKEDFPESSTNDDKNEIVMQNTQNELILLPEITYPKYNSAGSTTNDHEKGFDKINSNLTNISSAVDSILVSESQLKNPGISGSIIESTSDNLINNTNEKIVNEGKLYLAQTNSSSIIGEEKSKGCLKTSSNIRCTRFNKQSNKQLDKTSTKLTKKSNSVTDSEHSSKNTQNELIILPEITHPKYNSAGSTTNDHKNGFAKINSNLTNFSSAVDSILVSESQLKNPGISGSIIESTSDNLKNNTNEKVVNEGKLYLAQTNSSSVIGEEISKGCLKTSSNIRCTRFNKQSNKQLDKTSTQLSKRSNSVTDSEHISKKKKIEKPSPSNVERKTNSNNNKNAVKALNESIKQVSKNVYSRNSKGETQLHSACAKGKLNLVTSLLEDGFNPNVKDNAGWTPMHEAVKFGNLDIVKALIKHGAYLNVPGFEYESPLYTAIKYSKFEIAKTILDYGADANFINIYGDNARCLNKEKLSELLENQVSCKPTQICLTNYKLDEAVIALNNVSLKSATVNSFCKQFNIKLVQNILNEKQFAQVTHMVVSKTKNNTCDVNLECLTGIANGLFIINENWISDSLDKNELMKCENYEVSGTTFFTDCNGPKISRISKQQLYPKLFDGINIHVFGSNGWNQLTLDNLKKLVVEFGAKLLIRMPNPEDCPTNIIPYHCRNNDQMFHVSNIILYTMDSNRLIKYNMKHLKVFHISWFMEAIQKYNIFK